VLARFDGAGWSEARPVASGGAFFPTFHRGARSTQILLRTARPRGWMVLELSTEGSVERRALFAAEGPERPAVVHDTGAELTLSWASAGRPETATWEPAR
jgi:hypothetical protein